MPTFFSVEIIFTSQIVANMFYKVLTKCLIDTCCVMKDVSKPKYKIGDHVKFFCKYKNEDVVGEIINIRQANLNWDYNIRYEIHTDFFYIQWVEEKYIIDKIKK